MAVLDSSRPAPSQSVARSGAARLDGALTFGAVVLLAMTLLSPLTRAQRAKQNIAHRDASAYTPEHTMAAYRLALEQGADFVEQDLAVTRDGELICLHDDTLERTTNERWIPRAGREALVAFNTLQEDFDEDGRFRPLASDLTIKASYTFRF